MGLPLLTVDEWLARHAAHAGEIWTEDRGGFERVKRIECRHCRVAFVVTYAQVTIATDGGGGGGSAEGSEVWL